MWFWFVAMIWSMVVITSVLYQTLSSDIGELYDEVNPRRAEIGASSSRTGVILRDCRRRCRADDDVPAPPGSGAGTPAEP